MYYAAAEEPRDAPAEEPEPPPRRPATWTRVPRRARAAPRRRRWPPPICTAAATRFEHFLEKAFASPELLARLEAIRPGRECWTSSSTAHYFADQLLRYPELLDEIGEPFQLEGGPLQDGAALRRFYRRQMLRIQCESMLGRAPIFETLGKTQRPGRQRDRRRLPHRPGRSAAARRAPRYAAQRPDDGDRPGPPRHARVRPGQRRRPQFRHPRRRRRRAGLLDRRGRAHDPDASAPTPAKA